MITSLSKCVSKRIFLVILSRVCLHVLAWVFDKGMNKLEEVMRQVLHVRDTANAADMSDDARRNRAADMAMQLAALMGEDSSDGNGDDSDWNRLCYFFLESSGKKFVGSRIEICAVRAIIFIHRFWWACQTRRGRIRENLKFRALNSCTAWLTCFSTTCTPCDKVVIFRTNFMNVSSGSSLHVASFFGNTFCWMQPPLPCAQFFCSNCWKAHKLW